MIRKRFSKAPLLMSLVCWGFSARGATKATGRSLAIDNRGGVLLKRPYQLWRLICVNTISSHCPYSIHTHAVQIGARWMQAQSITAPRSDIQTLDSYWRPQKFGRTYAICKYVPMRNVITYSKRYTRILRHACDQWATLVDWSRLQLNAHSRKFNNQSQCSIYWHRFKHWHDHISMHAQPRS